MDIQMIRNTGLVYMTDTGSGYTRRKKEDQFIYVDEKGKTITDQQVLERIKKLAIPPAWSQVWISPHPQSYLQATGRDEKGRKQYRYHSDWIRATQENKFNRMLYFSQVLPAIRDTVRSDMKISGLRPEKVLATIVWLLDKTYIRIGNEEYARENEHFGLTTLRTRHVEVNGNTTTFEYVGKSGKFQKINIDHPRIARIIRKLEELPGYELFQYINGEGKRHPVSSQEVNDYLHKIGGQEISAKYFRTWGGTILAAASLYRMGDFPTVKQAKKNVTASVRQVSSHLRNTPAVCRRYYIHPAIPEAYLNKTLVPYFTLVEKEGSAVRNLSWEEFAVADLIKNQPSLQNPYPHATPS